MKNEKWELFDSHFSLFIFHLKQIVNQSPFLIDRELGIHGKLRPALNPLTSRKIWKINRRTSSCN